MRSQVKEREAQTVEYSKKKRKPLRIIIISISAFFVLLIVSSLTLTPVPLALIVRKVFEKSPAVAPNGYEEIKQQVIVTKDLTYPSKYKDNSADVYIPKDKEGSFPVILWVHGGAFVGGDKKDVEIYATVLASEGYAVVCMNYERAPEAKYPVPVLQTEEAYIWLKTISTDYQIDIERLILAGDSAGAHIAAQFALIQSNTEYAIEMEREPIVPLETFKAVLLFCGPYDVLKISKNGNFIFDFILGRMAWAYSGERNWLKHFAVLGTINNHVTKDFPPAFISDGNTMSFENHGRELAEILKEKSVPVETYFVPVETEIIKHEYQFIMNTPIGEQSFEKTLEFIKKYI